MSRLKFGSSTCYHVANLPHPEHNGQTWETVVRPVYACRQTMDPRKWELMFRVGDSIFSPMETGFPSLAMARYHAERMAHRVLA